MAEAVASAIRVSSFLRKEIVEIARQPRLVLTLVLGPFLVLLVFGAGLRDEDPEVRTVVVAPPNTPLTAIAERYAATQGRRLVIEDVAGDLDRALQRLRDGELDVVVAFPDDAAETVRSGRQATVTLYHDFIDPIETKAMELSAQQAVDRINNEISRGLVAQGQQAAVEVRQRLAGVRGAATSLEQAIRGGDVEAAQLQLALLERDVAGLALQLGASSGVVEDLGGQAKDGVAEESVVGALAAVTEQVDALGANGSIIAAPAQALRELEENLDVLAATLEEFGGLPPEVLVSPFRGEAEHVGPGAVGLTAFYAPAVVVLLAQHMVLSFVSLSIVREEQLGTTELFRVAPLTAAELLAGKFLAYLLLGAAVSTILSGLLVAGLGVPMRGSWLLLAVAGVVLLAASIAVGFVVALLAESDSQAVQYAMLVLLASIFFSGFILSLSRFLPPLDKVSLVLPATYGIELFRGIMLLGDRDPVPQLLVLTVMAAVLLVVSLLLLQRRLRSS